MGNLKEESGSLKIETEGIDLVKVRTKEIKKAETKMKDFATRLFNRKLKFFIDDYEKKIGKMPKIENDYIELATRVSRLERILEREGKMK